MISLEDAASRTPDPSRARKNLESFLDANPEYEDVLKEHLHQVAMLFAYTQFLANFSIKRPDFLVSQLRTMGTPVRRQELTEEFRKRIAALPPEEVMKAFREFRREIQIGITLRDVLRITDTTECMDELSDLADVIIQVAVDHVMEGMVTRFGTPADHALSIFGLGKLGARELNYSSDVDLIFVYGSDEGQTEGATGPSGSPVGSISNHEFYCRLATDFSKFLSQTTEDGFVYRVDLRLRPNGQRGDAALSLRSYEDYYESWGREWERLALVRARHVAGDEQLGDEFLEMIVPFVWRKYLDYSTIEEIRGLKMKIDKKFKKDDIKRGQGGIREIEFFIQAFQLIHGGKEPLLRNNRTLIALYFLRQKGLIGDEDQADLSDSYLYFRKIEHYIQMLNDIQTHSIPADTALRDALARKAGFASYGEFSRDLQGRRKKVHEIYNLFFRSETVSEDEGETLFIFEGRLDDDMLERFLHTKNVQDINSSMRYIQKIKEGVLGFHSLKGRKILREIAPGLLDMTMASSAPDRGLKNFVHFLGVVSLNESYLESFKASRDLSKALIDIFSRSEYLSKQILSSPAYLDMLSSGALRKKTLAGMKREIGGMRKEEDALNNSIRVFRKSEEIRLGLMFMNHSISSRGLMSGLSKVAETIVDHTIRTVGIELGLRTDEKVGIVAMGKLGGREITIGSDLDIIFYTWNSVHEKQIKASQKFLKVLQSYTHEGIAYKVDTRLRPDGSKGPLINSISGYRDYYLTHADSWEVQALLKARPISGHRKAIQAFMEMRNEAFRSRAPAIRSEEITQMRSRIMKELAKKEKGIDIKIDKGGTGEIEFLVQYIQLRHAGQLATYQSTVAAIDHMRKERIISENDAFFLKETYFFYRSVESYLRLAAMQVIHEEGIETEYLAQFLKFRDGKQFLQVLQETLERVAQLADRIYKKEGSG